MRGRLGMQRKMKSFISVPTRCAVPMGHLCRLGQELLRETRAENDSTRGSG